MKMKTGLVPIAEGISVEPILIIRLSSIAFPNPLEFIVIMDRLVDEAFDEVYSSKLSEEENENRVCTRYYQKIWNLMLEKGRDNNV